MTLQQLKYALTIADCGSMNEAAKQLFISQPSLSETMKELETEIGLDFSAFKPWNRHHAGGRRIFGICQTGDRAVRAVTVQVYR